MESLKRLEVGAIITAVPIVTPDTSISKIVGKLKDENSYEVILDLNGKVGMVTTRSILSSSNITNAKAKSLTTVVPQISPDTSVEEAARLMLDYRIRILPIVEKKSITGAVNALSIINLTRERYFSKVRAQDIMTTSPVTVTQDSLTSKARRLMISRKIDHLPVLNSGDLEGMLTSSQIVFNMFQATETIDRDELLSEQKRKLEFPVRHIMNPDPQTCEDKTNILQVLDNMIKYNDTCSIVTLWKEVHGIITYHDYMKIITTKLENREVPIYIIGLPDDPFEAEASKDKFTRIIQNLRKSFPYIEEAKAVIKTYSEGNKERKRYDVNVSIVTPRRTHAYSAKGWELPRVFDDISNKLKRMFLNQTKKDRHRRKTRQGRQQV